MLEYFPAHYSWNMGVLMVAQLGGELTEIDEACRPLQQFAMRPDAKNDPEAQAAWIERWQALAVRLEASARSEEKVRHLVTAARRYRRACIYYFTAERMASHKSAQKMPLYRSMLSCFKKSVTLGREPIEFVEVPYEGTTLPSLLYKAAGADPSPCMIHFDGFDATKEWIHLCGMAREYAARGISTLMIDHPGIGEALRLKALAVNYDTERWAKAAMDYLETRPDIDANRVGVAAMSLGGYYAPRAAAFEKRLACCVAWGARWDNKDSHGRILRDPNAARSITGWVDHALWYYGANTTDEAYEKICQMSLEGIADRISCPILVVHGSGDRQVPLEQAERTIREAVNSPRRNIRIFTAEEGGVEHCSGDLFSIAIDAIGDWVAEVLNTRTTSDIQDNEDESVA